MWIVANPRMPEILAAFNNLSSLMARRGRILSTVQLLLEEGMANEQDLRDHIQHLKDLIIADQTGDQAVVDALVAVREQLKTKVAELQAQIDAGQQPTVDFDSLIADIQNLETLIVPAKDNSVPVDPTVPPGETPVNPDAPPGIASLRGNGT